jgi:hypothetical protein
MTGPLVPLEVVTSTAELAWRTCRAPQYEVESQVLVELAGQMIRSPANILEHLVKAVMRVCRGGSAGVSIIEEHQGEELFRPRALRGEIRTPGARRLATSVPAQWWSTATPCS